jgi:hypothetical protein
MFKVIGSVTNEYFKPILRQFPVVSTAMRKGALVTKALNTTSLSLATTGTAISAWGVTTHAVASAAGGSAIIELCPSGTVFEADVSEIYNNTTLTATGGGTTSFVDSSIVTGEDDALIGLTFQVVTCAANALVNGTTMTVTDYTSSSGTLAVASFTGGFASGDTMKIKTLSNYNIAGAKGPYQDATYADSIVLDQTATAASLFKVLGTNADGTKLQLILLNGINSLEALS